MRGGEAGSEGGRWCAWILAMDGSSRRVKGVPEEGVGAPGCEGPSAYRDSDGISRRAKGAPENISKISDRIAMEEARGGGGGVGAPGCDILNRRVQAGQRRTCGRRAQRERVGVPGCEGTSAHTTHFQSGQRRTCGRRALAGPRKIL